MAVKPKPYEPDVAVPTGNTVAVMLRDQGRTADDLARCAGWTAQSVAAMLDGTLEVTPEVADRLTATVGLTAGFWLRREANYRRLLAKLGPAKVATAP